MKKKKKKPHDIKETPEMKEYVQCPSCGFLMTMLQFSIMRYDMKCPACGVKSISQFTSCKK